MSRPGDDVCTYLDRAIPGSLIDEGYSFVFFACAQPPGILEYAESKHVDGTLTTACVRVL